MDDYPFAVRDGAVPTHVDDGADLTPENNCSHEARRPLWLSRHEAEALLTLLAAAPPCVPEEVELRLFRWMGDLLRSYGRAVA